MGMRFRS